MENPAAFAIDCVDSILNGNTTSTIKKIATLPKTQAMVVTGYVIHYLSEERTAQSTDIVGVVLRALERIAT